MYKAFFNFQCISQIYSTLRFKSNCLANGVLSLQTEHCNLLVSGFWFLSVCGDESFVCRLWQPGLAKGRGTSVKNFTSNQMSSGIAEGP